MTERTKFLREETVSGRNKTARCIMPPYDVSGEPGGIPIRKALGFKTICENMPLYIGPEELIVGTRTFFSATDYSAGQINWSTPPLIAFPKFINEGDIRRFGQDYSGSNGQHYTPDFGILLSKGIGGSWQKHSCAGKTLRFVPTRWNFWIPSESFMGPCRR